MTVTLTNRTFLLNREFYINKKNKRDVYQISYTSRLVLYSIQYYFYLNDSIIPAVYF